ncbi:hypothetical protein MKX68_11480 [Paenibacillus sp. FSL M8-0212]|uniref:hypothetical protein n=1 Tax=Paenibacillus sp. FSL M8-0212 TaxID=2921618 RepID=UPI0030F81A9A
MDLATVKKLLEEILNSITNPNGSVAIENFASLRDVDAKVREVKMLLQELPGNYSILNELENDNDFTKNSRRVRLEALSN